MENKLSFNRVVVTKLNNGQLLKTWRDFSYLRDEDIDHVIHATRHILTETIAKILEVRLELAVYWVKYQLRTNQLLIIGTSMF